MRVLTSSNSARTSKEKEIPRNNTFLLTISFIFMYYLGYRIKNGIEPFYTRFPNVSIIQTNDHGIYSIY